MGRDDRVTQLDLNIQPRLNASTVQKSEKVTSSRPTRRSLISATDVIRFQKKHKKSKP